MPPGVSLLVLSLAQGAIRFLGTPQCPDAAAVEGQLRLVDPRVLESSAPRLVMLEQQPGGLQVRLFDEGGQLLEERLVPGSKSCAEWARIAAALLATWETDLAAPELSMPPRSPEPPAQTVAVPPPPKKRPRWQGEIGLGLSGSVANDGSFALGGALLTDFAPPAGAFGGQLIFTGTGYRSLPILGGSAQSAHWQRFALGLGGRGRLGAGALKLELGAQFLAALLSLRQSLSKVAFDPGLGLSSRGLWSFAPHWLAWLGLGASFWPVPQGLDFKTSPSGPTIHGPQVPPVDVAVTIGLSVTGDL